MSHDKTAVNEYQAKSIGMHYINRFIIDENDQFEIKAVIFVDDFDEDSVKNSQIKVNKAVEAVNKQSKHETKGSDISIKSSFSRY